MADFEKRLEKVRGRNARVVAMSVDSRDDAAGTVEKLGLSFPVAYGVDRDEIADAVGAYENHDPPHLQPADFILEPDGTVALAVYSTGAVGRLHADEAVDELEFFQEDES